MSSEQAMSVGTLLTSLVIGFLVFIAYDTVKKTGPLDEEPITSNKGSIMIYMIWQAGISLVLTFGATLLTIEIYGIFDGNPPEAAFWSVPAMFALAGVAYAYAALLRAKDAGRTRGFALLGIVPIANLWLIFASPKKAPERPAYVPAWRIVRIAIALVAVVISVGLRTLQDEASRMLFQAQVADRVEERVAIQNERLPKQLNEMTTLEEVNFDASQKEIVYRYSFASSDIDAASIQAWLANTMKPRVTPSTCQDPVVAEFGWVTRFRYLDADENLVAEMSISNEDC
ncbi:hypothetical protein [Afifella aestuarii]|uniref:hypothetical protein n=1 Tax=Afifella aestuarii TaxID=1909496 RepID=UPI000FE440D7|nr:hypothetical protein [Afifella aestuarii]